MGEPRNRGSILVEATQEGLRGRGYRVIVAPPASWSSNAGAGTWRAFVAKPFVIDQLIAAIERCQRSSLR